MKPSAVMIQLCYLYGRQIDWISQTLDESPHIVARVIAPVRHLRGVAQG